MAISQTLYLILKTWWWVLLPAILYFPLRFIYLWWVQWDIWYKEQEWILLEVKAPREILKPFRAMEDVLSRIWGIFDAPNWRERWLWGEPLLPYWFSLEIVSIEGEIHFFIRALEAHRHTIESAIYAQYPEVEISQVPDYTKNIPQDIPNKDWDLYGEAYQMGKEDYFPIKTYSKFFEERPEVVKEEKRIDPVLSLLESMVKLGKGEQFWFQIIAVPITDKQVPYIRKGKEMVNKLVFRAPKRKKSMVGEAAEFLITGRPPGVPPEEEKKEMIIPPEMKLTPGEREIVQGIENKIAKYAYRATVRGIYLARKDAFNAPHRLTARAYMNHFSTANLNFFVYWPRTRTRVHYWARKARLYLRKRKIFRSYIRRLSPLFPFPPGKGAYVLSNEELATIYHFPYQVIIPGVARVEAKRGGPPPIPTE
ncbi:hypothetical protein KJA17_01710 [Patescibacteria group bacterium]|nr:hypothetical protein [Patescibacteria group bacterium]